MTKPYKVGIIGTGSKLPDTKLTNLQLESTVETTDEWIMKRTGIRERGILDKEIPLTKLAADASMEAINDAGIKATDIDLIIATTVTPDYLTPSLSCCVQKEIQAKNAAAFDLNAACTGFIYALQVAQEFIKSGTYKHILVVSAEALSRVTDYGDRKTCVLFGDGAGAVVVSAVPEEYGIESSVIGAMGEDGRVLTLPGFYWNEEDVSNRNEGKIQVLWMDGSEVFTFASRIMVESTEQVLQKSGLSTQDIQYVIPHQANIRILQNAAKKLGISMEKIYSNLETTGNISSASIPVCIAEASRKNLIKKGDKIVLVAFGGGLTYGATALTWFKN